ncbi:DUF6205 family protein [Streptomyces chumphonensis]|uniref:DUF6205 family protein n=1 Tax=Streptomyces chumphonensis TaxID=1214925 RepID=UPI003D754B54
MGYYTTVEGEITITPPLTWAELKDSPFGRNPNPALRDVTLVIAEEKVDTDEGPLLRRTGTALVPTYADGYKAYHLVEHVQEAIDAFPGHTFAGRLDCSGADAGDMWRVVVRDGRAVEVRPRIVWPDED